MVEVTKIHQIEIQFDLAHADDSDYVDALVEYYRSDGYEEWDQEDFDGELRLITLKKIQK